MIRTSGDRIQDRPLAEAGGKGLFTKEIDAALLAGEIDAAVHSAKDLPSLMPEGVTIAAALKREDVRDALISAFADTIEGLPRGATFGAASLRRQAQALALRPDLKPELLRGNVETRLKKAESGAVGATLLALAGLKRLGLGHRARAVLDIDEFLPAPGRARSRSPRAARRPRAQRSSRSRTPRRRRRSRPSAPFWPNSKAPAAPRSPASPASRPGGSRFSGEVLRPDGSERFAIAAEGAPADAERLDARQGANSRPACPRECWRGPAERDRWPLYAKGSGGLKVRPISTVAPQSLAFAGDPCIEGVDGAFSSASARIKFCGPWKILRSDHREACSTRPTKG